MNDLLSQIELIQEAQTDSELDIITSLSEAYTKSFLILQECDESVDVSSFDIFQEGQLFDDFKGYVKGPKGESILKKILLFIPRLLVAIVKLIGKFVSAIHDKLLRRNSAKYDPDQFDDQDIVGDISIKEPYVYYFYQVMEQNGQPSKWFDVVESITKIGIDNIEDEPDVDRQWYLFTWSLFKASRNGVTLLQATREFVDLLKKYDTDDFTKETEILPNQDWFDQPSKMYRNIRSLIKNINIINDRYIKQIRGSGMFQSAVDEFKDDIIELRQMLTYIVDVYSRAHSAWQKTRQRT